jgi:hypothetical protein
MERPVHYLVLPDLDLMLSLAFLILSSPILVRSAEFTSSLLFLKKGAIWSSIDLLLLVLGLLLLLLPLLFSVLLLTLFSFRLL